MLLASSLARVNVRLARQTVAEDYSKYTWEELLEAADADTGHFSFTEPFTNHWGVQEIVRRINDEEDCDFLERIAAELNGDSSKCHHWAYTLFGIFGELPEFAPEVRGRMSMVNAILFDWMKQKGYIK